MLVLYYKFNWNHVEVNAIYDPLKEQYLLITLISPHVEFLKYFEDGDSYGLDF